MPGVAVGNVDLDLPRDGGAKLRLEALGHRFVEIVGAELLLHLPARAAEEHGAPGVGHRGGNGAVFWLRVYGEVLTARPAGRLVQQGVLIELQVGGKIVGGRGIAKDRANPWRERLLHVEVDAAHGAMQIDLLIEELPRAKE